MQNTYSQNKEDLFVLDYFGDYKGTLLDIGANDGITLSNSRLLIEHEWKAILLEPGEVCLKLDDLYASNENVSVGYFGIGETNGRVKFWESGAHVKDGKDVGLVSTTNFEETKRWPDVEFTERKIQLSTFKSFHENYDHQLFDFISIDAEGQDLSILQQINLEAVGCRCLCIEWNSDNDLAQKFVDYCKGYKVAHVNAENLIFVKQ